MNYVSNSEGQRELIQGFRKFYEIQADRPTDVEVHTVSRILSMTTQL
jgi:hypothetical protein